MKQIIIRTRRELEAQSGSSITLEELLGLYNDLIHDLEFSMEHKKKNKNLRNLKTVEEQENLLSQRDVHSYPRRIKKKLRRNVYLVPQTPII